MSDLAAKRGAVPAAKKALFLVFHIGGERFALKATEVAEVLPRLPLKPIAHAPVWVAGIFAHRGALVPVIDLCALTFGTPAQARTSTRLVLVNYQPQPWVDARWLGLILEQTTDTLRCGLEEFQPYGLDNREAPYLGLVREDALGLMQWIGVNELLTEPVRTLLFSAELSV
ncbi:purine-binding chemotaxis protein CheW [Pseudomonas poae]|uniref:Purine-binding chemotaxis protein CheW n=1 Tax=Pseudomonas poae TaxID=200451 RepID=A0A7M1KD71_9PSED|nr:chemotaxis protein CheW [Pseudomonas poae]QOQ73330.1 purine-binding chemotaxis protein CheW [Pseudomonas poae]